MIKHEDKRLIFISNWGITICLNTNLLLYMFKIAFFDVNTKKCMETYVRKIFYWRLLSLFKFKKKPLYVRN